MERRYQTYGIITRQNLPEVGGWQDRLRWHLQAEHPELTPAPAREAELLLVLGGDGTLLETLRNEALSKATLLALNTGHVGFLTTERDPDRFLTTVEAALEGRLERMPVPVMEVIHQTRVAAHAYRAVNDLLVERTMVWSTFRLEQVGPHRTDWLKDVRGSGLCLCSAIGSTSPMAAHFQAPLIDPRVPAFYVKGVNDRQPPTGGRIVSAAESLALRLTLTEVEPNLGLPEDQRESPSLYLDGAYRGTLSIGDRIEVRAAKNTGTLLRWPNDLHHDRVRASR